MLNANEIRNKHVVTCKATSQVKQTKLTFFFVVVPNETTKEIFIRSTNILNNLSSPKILYFLFVYVIDLKMLI